MKLILNKKTWRCGLSSIHEENKLGKGDTCLLNDEGYMCCLGQFSLQFNQELVENDILGIEEPYEVYKAIPELNLQDEQDKFNNTKLSRKAITINDDISTTVNEKIDKLKTLFKEYGHEIVVID